MPQIADYINQYPHVDPVNLEQAALPPSFPSPLSSPFPLSLPASRSSRYLSTLPIFRVIPATLQWAMPFPEWSARTFRRTTNSLPLFGLAIGISISPLRRSPPRMPSTLLSSLLSRLFVPLPLVISSSAHDLVFHILPLILSDPFPQSNLAPLLSKTKPSNPSPVFSKTLPFGRRISPSPLTTTTLWLLLR